MSRTRCLSAAESHSRANTSVECRCSMKYRDKALEAFALPTVLFPVGLAEPSVEYTLLVFMLDTSTDTESANQHTLLHWSISTKPSARTATPTIITVTQSST
ncbi:hypothetical protein HGRIS_001165 [Hohenbuehelia grisea]|uniref:Uncharacterized protein n=1 Tax=Hohenbuehelia grisea TaxID=104357 RepID=A0ABR3JNP3_9AGAR